VTGRASVFSNQRIIDLLNESFVPVAIDINHLMHQEDSEGKFFRHIAEQGHFAGKTKPAATRQGLYITGVDGDLVDSLNSTRARTVLKLINRGIAKWEKRNSVGDRMIDSNTPDARHVFVFPEGGMILQETMRDLPTAAKSKRDLRRHNFDHVWLTAEQKKSFVPSSNEPGHSWEIPESLMKTLAAYNMIDQVHGEAFPFSVEHVQKAEMTAKVVSVDGEKVTVQLLGVVRNLKPATGAYNPYNKRTVDEDISSDLKLSGWLVYDTSKRDFESFRMLAAGQRSGGDVYNSRWKDMGPSPIGFAFQMVEDIPSNRIRPKYADREAYRFKK